MESPLLFACSNISQSTHLGSCHVLNLSNSQPLWLARPIYGLAAPIIILVTLITNSLVVVVLSHRNLRTPTNHILLAMAVAELMTGLSSCPWFIYYYTLGGFLTDQHEGLNEFWCRFHSYFAVHFPTIFHTTAIWLTVFLAIQRYVYVCVPSMVCKYCNPTRTRQMIAIIVTAALLNEMPVMLFQSSVSLQLSQKSRLCIRLYAPLIEQTIGANAFYSVILCYRAIFIHSVPCALLIVFTGKLFRTINEADRKRSFQSFPSRKTLFLLPGHVEVLFIESVSLLVCSTFVGAVYTQLAYKQAGKQGRKAIKHSHLKDTTKTGCIGDKEAAHSEGKFSDSCKRRGTS